MLLNEECKGKKEYGAQNMQIPKQFIIILFLFLIIVMALTPVDDAVNSTFTATASSFSPFNVSATGGAEIIRVATSRYSIFAPWQRTSLYPFNLSANFTAFALLLNNGLPDPGKNITFEIYANGTLKKTLFNITQQNGLASVSYNASGDFTIARDTDYGNWTITAYNTSLAVNASTNMSILEGGNGVTGAGSTCGMNYCHYLGVIGTQPGTNGVGGNYPHSPYTGGYGNDSTFAEAAHLRSSHSSGTRGCYLCHPGYAANKTGVYSYTNDVHRNLTCKDCHGDWTYIKSNLTVGGGAGIPKIKSCYDCHPKDNNNLTQISTLVNLTPGTGTNINVTGKNISVYSYNYSTGAPLTAHKGTESSLIASVPCVVCHGPAHNISKPDPLPANRNNITEDSQCTACHTTYTEHNSSNTTSGGVNCTLCHSQDAHTIKVFAQNASYISLNRNNPNPARGNCTNCHQNATFFPVLKAQPMAGGYTGRNPPQVTFPLNHSNDPNAGQKWNQTPGYWNNSNQLTWCRYCHGNTTHYAIALGRPSLFAGNNTVNSTISSSSSWCASCHWQGYSSGVKTYNDTASTFNFPDESLLVPPEITGNASFWPTSNPAYYNHSGFSDYNDSTCNYCHGNSTLSTITGFMHNVAASGGPNCTNCHDINGSGAPQDKRITVSSMKLGVHKNLNSNAASSTSLDPINKACWACHGDGSEPAGHPPTNKTPKNCNNNDCHSLSQSQYNEPMVYSHFQNASLNGNPNNVTNYNLTTTEQCQNCHINSLVITDNYTDLALVSHYASKDNLIESFKCTYCHLVKNNSEAWGNATLIYTNTTSLVELDKERNKLTAYEGQSIYLGDGYSMKVVEISTERSEALIQLLKNYGIVDETSLRVGVPYNYEEYITIDNGTFRTPIIILNITSIFKGASKSFIQFSGFRTARVHAETNSTSCFACHLYRYSPEKGRYLVIDRDTKDDPNQDIIYYTNVLVDFISENKSKIYYNDDDYVLSQINTDYGNFLTSPSPEKYLTEGETWDIGENVSLKLYDVATDSKQALLALMINNSVVEDWAVTSGSEFNYTRPIRYKGYEDTNVTIFSAKVASIAQANPNFVLLKDVVAISPWIRQTTANTTVSGFNSSWLFPNDTFIVGKVPENFHAPDLYTDQRAWADCVKCHDISRKLNIPNVDAISSRLGKHDRLNINASSGTILSDSIDKACWACHTPDGQEPNAHSPTYVTPRDCKSCHVYEEKPDFAAINISDEPHALEQNCESCHIQNSHTLIRFDVSPVINQASLSQTEVSRNETINLVAEAIGGYKMKIRAAEYFLDKIGVPGNGTPLKPAGGAFDSQIKKVTSDINTTDITPGQHTLYIHAMERDNRWGEFYPVNFTIFSDPQGVVQNKKNAADLDFGSIIISLMVVYLIISKRIRIN
jgi:hypothetical protein